MNRQSTWGALTLTGLLVGLTIHAVAPAQVHLHTRDTNRDGRPDVWQYYDDRGVLLRVSVDTNFDGRSDVQESYRDGRLVRRESDRNFDDRVDLIDDFDAITGAQTRAVVDADFDGRADLLVLFADGKPVFSQWVATVRDAPSGDAAAPGSPRRADDVLVELDNPFSAAAHLQAEAISIANSLGCLDVRWMQADLSLLGAIPRALGVPAPEPVDLRPCSVGSFASRGPPAADRLL